MSYVSVVLCSEISDTCDLYSVYVATIIARNFSVVTGNNEARVCGLCKNRVRESE